MSKLMFEVKLSADGRILCVDIKLPGVIDERSLDLLFTQLIKAFNQIESPLDAIRGDELLETMKYSRRGTRRMLLFRRSYTDPAYPTRFAEVLRCLSGDVPVLH